MSKKATLAAENKKLKGLIKENEAEKARLSKQLGILQGMLGTLAYERKDNTLSISDDRIQALVDYNVSIRVIKNPGSFDVVVLEMPDS